MNKPEKSIEKGVIIPPLQMERVVVCIRGTSPYVSSKFSQKARDLMKKNQEEGSTTKKNTKKVPKDFHLLYELSRHQSEEGWFGIPAPAFRSAMISACKVCGYAMTRAKLSVFVPADGVDIDDGTPLVRITKGEPHYVEHMVRIQMTTDIRARSMWDVGWEASVTIEYDAEQFRLEDVVNLMVRVGRQVGVGEGRADSKTSGGMGWGHFEVVNAMG